MILHFLKKEIEDNLQRSAKAISVIVYLANFTETYLFSSGRPLNFEGTLSLSLSLSLSLASLPCYTLRATQSTQLEDHTRKRVKVVF